MIHQVLVSRMTWTSRLQSASKGITAASSRTDDECWRSGADTILCLGKFPEQLNNVWLPTLHQLLQLGLDDSHLLIGDHLVPELVLGV